MPGVTFGVFGLDSFPFALILALIMFAKGNIKLSVFGILLLLFSFIICALTTFFDLETFSASLGLRQYLNYASIILCGEVLKAHKFTHVEILKALEFALFANILIGSLQLSGLEFYVSNARTDAVRGAVGLFAEPTSLGLFSFAAFIIGVYCIRSTNDRVVRLLSKRIIVTSLAVIILIAQSSTAIMMLALFTVLSLVRLNFRVFLFSLFALFLAVFTFDFWSGTRFGGIVTTLTSKDILYLLAADGSVNERLSAVFGPYYGLINNYLMPSSAFSYHENFISFQEFTNQFFWFGGSNKIMNYMGTVIYEMSLLGFILLARYVLPLARRRIDFEILSVWVFYLSNGVPLAHGYVLLLNAIHNQPEGHK